MPCHVVVVGFVYKDLMKHVHSKDQARSLELSQQLSTRATILGVPKVQGLDGAGAQHQPGGADHSSSASS